MICKTCGHNFIQSLPEQKECYMCSLLKFTKNYPSGLYYEPNRKYFKRIKIKSSWEMARDEKK